MEVRSKYTELYSDEKNAKWKNHLFYMVQNGYMPEHCDKYCPYRAETKQRQGDRWNGNGTRGQHIGYIVKSVPEFVTVGEQLTTSIWGTVKGGGIIDIADNDINEVSGGQLQRACICRSMINMPKVLFADEPTGALNRTASNEVMEELVKLNEEGTTIMMVTHDAKVAAKCSRVLYIVDGNIKGEYISPKDLEIKEKDRERLLNNWLLELGW